MSWLGIAPAVGMAVLILAVPGALVAVAFGLRRFAVLGLAPAFSMSFIVIASTLAPFVHLSWGVLPFGVITLMGVLAVWAMRRLFGWPTRTANYDKSRLHPLTLRLHYVAYVAGLGLAALLIGRDLLIAFVNPDSFSQTYDNIFHLNALRYIQETGSASSLSIGQMAGSSFYPAGWHALASLVQEVTGASIPVAINATNLVIGAFVWPVSMVFLIRTIFGRRPVAIFTGALLSAGFAAFPLLMIDFGVLYPNYLGLALLPACLAQLLRALSLAPNHGDPRVREWVMLGGAVIGMSLAHPNSALSLVAFAVILVVLVYVRYVRSSKLATARARSNIVISTVLLIVFLGAVGILWRYVRPPAAAAFWPPTQTTAQAVGEALLSAPMRMAPTWVIAVLVILGLFYCVRRPKMRPSLAIFVVGCALYVVVSGVPAGAFRSFITGVWYNDSFRLAAMLPMVLIPVAVAGVIAVRTFLAKVISGIRGTGTPFKAEPISAIERPSFPKVGASAGAALGAAYRSRGSRGNRLAPLVDIVGLALLSALLIFAAQQGQVATERANARSLYEVRADSPLITSDELAILERLDAHVPSNAVIAGSPYTGTALAYALADRKTLQLHILSALSPQIQAIDTGLRDAPADAAACSAIRDLHVGYVLDFGTQEIHYEDHPYHGVEDLQGSSAVQLIDQQGSARLYKIAVCQD